MSKLIILPLLLVFIMGCNDGAEEAYNNSFNNGLDSIASEDFVRSEVYFEQALDARPDDQRALSIIYQLKQYQEAENNYDLEKYDESLENIEHVINTQNGSSGMTSKAQNLKDKVQLAAKQLTTTVEFEAIDLEETNEAEELLDKNEEESLPDEVVDSEGEESVSITTQNVEEQDNTSEILDAYNSLSLPLKVILAATTVDERAMTPELLGFYLYYNFDENTLFVNVHSGAGTGHPWYSLKYDRDTITPVGGIVWQGMGGYQDTYVDTEPVSKIVLYNRYMAAKESYDIAVQNVFESEEMDMAEYEKIRSEF